MTTIYVTRDFKQGSEVVIKYVFDDFVEIETDKPENYQTWQITGRDFELESLKKQAIAQDKKIIGLPYELNGVSYNVPITSEDAVGLLQVKAAFELGVTETNLKFSNNVVMPITSAEFPDFAVWFTTERNKFFV